MYHILRSIITTFIHTHRPYLHDLLTQLRIVLSPPRCVHCALLLDKLALDSIFCTSCTQKIMPIVSHTIQLSTAYNMTIFAITDYQEPIKSLILAKHRSDIVASKQLGQLIWQHTYISHIPIDCFVPIPLHWSRFAHRGYNQASEIAHVLARNTGKPIINTIKRTKKTRFQSTLVHVHRLNNVRDAFTLTTKQYNSSYFRDKHIILVDDLMTTGATLTTIAKMLIKFKPASINAVVACRVV